MRKSKRRFLILSLGLTAMPSAAGLKSIWSKPRLKSRQLVVNQDLFLRLESSHLTNKSYFPVWVYKNIPLDSRQTEGSSQES